MYWSRHTTASMESPGPPGMHCPATGAGEGNTHREREETKEKVGEDGTHALHVPVVSDIPQLHIAVGPGHTHRACE